MIQYGLYRKQFLRRHSSSLKQAAALLAAGALLCGSLAFFHGKDKAETAAAQPSRAFERHAEEILNGPATGFQSKPYTAAPAARAPLAAQLSSIQDGIASMLEAGNSLLVSEKKVIVGKGDTLMDLLVRKAFVPREEAYQAVAALSKVYNPRDIYPGREITVFFHKDPAVADPKFKGIRIEQDMINAVTVNRDDDGDYTVNKEEKEVRRTLNGYRGTISSSLYVDARAAGVPDSVILDLIKMYSWNVDFQREIRAGDAFEVMYEEYKTEDGRTVRGKGNILYAKLTLGGQSLPFYRFEDSQGVADYYDDTGRSAKKPLMRTPIDGARLSSGFGMRKHPVLGYSKKHMGVDFAAPRGTPVYAAGDGRIVRIGPFSSFGNYIRISHRAGLETAYAHLSKFKSGLKPGSRVKQGTVIGYVGTTGRSTGPHLHYEVIVNNVQVNPASVKLPIGRALKGKELKSFQAVMAEASSQFNSLGRATSVASR